MQHTPSHIGILRNEERDRAANRAAGLPPGTRQFNLMHSNIQAQVRGLLVLPGPPQWPQSTTPSASRSGTQSLLYMHLKATHWLTGVPCATLAKRAQRWWGPSWTSFRILTLFQSLGSSAPRFKWVLYTCLLGEWATGRNLRHMKGPHTPVPPCRFCGLHTDCVQHWFGSTMAKDGTLAGCHNVIDRMSRHFSIQCWPPDGLLELTLTKPFLVAQILYAVHSVLRWNRANMDNATLAEGAWLSQWHATQVLSSKLKVDKDRLKTRRAARKARATAR